MNDVELRFTTAFEEIATECAANTARHGFTESNFPEKIALAHSELSEALEGYRNGNPPSEKIPEFTSIEEELADVIIRLMSEASTNNRRLGQAIIAKMTYNASRPFKHGGKVC